MGTAIGVIVCIAVCYGIGWLWEEASKKKGAVGAAARGAEAVADGVGSVVRVVIGVGLILGGIAALILLLGSGDVLAGLGSGLALVAAGIWVLVGGGLTIPI